MDRFSRLCALLAIVVSISSCLVKSIHPICSAQDSIMVPGLVGTWQDAKGEMTVIVSKSTGNTYRVVYLDKDNPSVFSGRVARFGGKMFMDIIPVSIGWNNNLDNLSRLSAHMIFRLEQDRDRLSYSCLDINWMKQALTSGTIKVAHEARVDENSPNVELILTASTKDLGEFLSSVANNGNAFFKPVELMQVKQQEHIKP